MDSHQIKSVKNTESSVQRLAFVLMSTIKQDVFSAYSLTRPNNSYFATAIITFNIRDNSKTSEKDN